MLQLKQKREWFMVKRGGTTQILTENAKYLFILSVPNQTSDYSRMICFLGSQV